MKYILILTISLLFGFAQSANEPKNTVSTMNQELIGKTITSSHLSTTELHAGGIFFSIIFEESITFNNDSTVVLKQKVMNEFRPMDNQDVDRINNTEYIGKLVENTREYISIEFEDMSFTGLPVEGSPKMYSFNIFDRKLGTTSSRIYYLNA